MTSHGPQWQEFSLPGDDRPRLRGRVWFDVVDGRPSVVGLELWARERVRQPWVGEVPGEPDPGWPASLLRAKDVHSIKVGELRDEWVRHSLGLAQAIDVLHGTDLLERFEAPLTAHERRGRPRLSDRFLEQVAEVYLAAVGAGSRRPAREVAERFSTLHGREYNATTVRGWIRKAADADLLTKGQPGRARGPITER